MVSTLALVSHRLVHVAHTVQEASNVFCTAHVINTRVLHP
jgi:hypothetical protein